MADSKRLYGDALGDADDDGKEDAGEAAGGGGAPEAGDGADPQAAAGGAAVADKNDLEKNDLDAWLASVHASLVVYAKVFKAEGYDDLELVKEMLGPDRDALFAALDAGKIKTPHRRKMVAALDELLGAIIPGEKQPSPSPRCHCYSGDDYGEMDNHTLSFSIHLRASFFLVFILFLRPMCIPNPASPLPLIHFVPY